MTGTDVNRSHCSLSGHSGTLMMMMMHCLQFSPVRKGKGLSPVAADLVTRNHSFSCALTVTLISLTLKKGKGVYQSVE